jgi:Fe-S-cluster containining protein
VTFPCIKCGLCCRALKNVSAATEYNRGDGVCKYLDGNLCSVYTERPLLCNVEGMYQAYFKDSMDEDTFFKMNLNACIEIAKRCDNKEVAQNIEKVLAVNGYVV